MAELSLTDRIVAILFIVIPTIILTEMFIKRLFEINSRQGKTIEQSGGLFIEYDHYYIWAWFKFPIHFIETSLYFWRLSKGSQHPTFALTSSFKIAVRRCIWQMKYRPLHATQAEVLEYYRRVKWAKEVPPPLPPDDNIAPPAIKL